MEITFNYRPSNTAAKLNLSHGESVTTEGGAMIAMSSNFSVETTTHKRGQGSILKSVKRIFAGESLFLNHYTAQGNGELWLCAPLPGDMKEITLMPKETLFVQAGSFVACESSVEMDVGFQGFKNLLSGESLFWLKLVGPGKIILSAFGEIYPIAVGPEGHIVDGGHVVAFEESVNYSLSKAGGSWLHSFLGGEGLVCDFQGKGVVWCQSHHPKNFGKNLTPHLIRRS